MIRVVRESGVIHPLHPRVSAQELGHPPAVLDVTVDPDRDGLDALEQQERAQRRQHRAHRPLIDAATARDIGGRTEMRRVDQAVIGRVGHAEHRKPRGVLLPGELAVVDDDAAERRAVSAHEFRQRVQHDVGAVLERAQQNRRGNRVVDDQRNAVPVGDLRQRFDIADVARRVSHALAEHRSRVRIDELLDGRGMVALGESNIDAESRQEVSKQRIGGAVELRHGDDVSSALGEIEHRVVQRGLPGGYAEGLHSAFERGDAPLEHFVGRIADAGIAVSLDLEIEQRRSVLGAVERIGHGLINRNGHGLRRGLDLIAAVNGDRFVAHRLRHHSQPPDERISLRTDFYVVPLAYFFWLSY